MNNILIITRYGFTVIGLGLLIGAFFIYKNTAAFLENAVQTEGTVTQLVKYGSTDSGSSYYKPVVNFLTQQGQSIEFTSPTGSIPAAYSEGDKVVVIYLPEAPQSAKIKNFFSLWGDAAIVGGLGCVFFLIGFVMVALSIRKKRLVDYLKHHGTPVETSFQGVQRNGALQVNGQNPFVVLTQWQNPETSKIHIFKSHNVWYDPTQYISDQPVKVLIDRNNPKKYYVDLSFLPETAD